MPTHGDTPQRILGIIRSKVRSGRDSTRVNPTSVAASTARGHATRRGRSGTRPTSMETMSRSHPAARPRVVTFAGADPISMTGKRLHGGGNHAKTPGTRCLDGHRSKRARPGPQRWRWTPRSSRLGTAPAQRRLGSSTANPVKVHRQTSTREDTKSSHNGPPSSAISPTSGPGARPSARAGAL